MKKRGSQAGHAPNTVGGGPRQTPKQREQRRLDSSQPGWRPGGGMHSGESRTQCAVVVRQAPSHGQRGHLGEGCGTFSWSESPSGKRTVWAES